MVKVSTSRGAHAIVVQSILSLEKYRPIKQLMLFVFRGDFSEDLNDFRELYSYNEIYVVKILVRHMLLSSLHCFYYAKFN